MIQHGVYFERCIAANLLRDHIEKDDQVVLGGEQNSVQSQGQPPFTNSAHTITSSLYYMLITTP